MVKNMICENLNQESLKDYKKTIKEALSVLGKKNFSIIIHGPSFPSLPSEDTGIGTINSKGGRDFVDFIEGLGFNSIQLGPDGKTKSNDASPYIGTIFSTNPLFIDLAELTTDEWDGILSKKTLDGIIANNPKKGTLRAAYTYIFDEQISALFEAYNNFIAKSKKSKTIKALAAKFEQYKKDSAIWLDQDALYEALTKKHGNDYWPAWKDELDKKLFSPENIGTKAQKERIAELEKDYKQEIDFYKFCQFVGNYQKEKTKNYTLAHGIKTMADIQVAFSDRDHWAYQSLFLPGYYLGCPPDIFSAEGQAWGFPVLDPEKLYNEDGSLGESGKLYKFRFDKVFKENPGGARIDHAVGLIDPWVYKIGKSAKPKDGGSRLFSSPENDAFKKYALIGYHDLNKYGELDEPEFKLENPNDIICAENELRVKESSVENENVLNEYAKVVDIIVKSAEEHKIDREFIIFEDLGTITNPVKMVMRKRNLSGIRVTQFANPKKHDNIYLGRNVDKHHWITIGTHDNVPLSVYVNDLYDSNKIHDYINVIIDDLIPEERAHERQAYREKLGWDRNEFMKAKFVEMFISPSENAQVFFNDLFGIEELYNKPGTSGSENWSLRVPNDFKAFYFQQLAENKALNLAEILKTSIEAKGSKFVAENKLLVEKLGKYAEQIKN